MPLLGYSSKQLDRIAQSPRQRAREYARSHHLPMAAIPHPTTPVKQFEHLVHEQQRNESQYDAMVNPLSHENLAFGANFAKNLVPQSLIDLAHGHAPSGKHLGEDALFFLPWSRGVRAAGEAIKAAHVAEEGARAVEAGRAARGSYKAGKGIIGGLAGQGKKLLPAERALRASPARKELFQHLDSVFEPKVAQAQKNLFDKSVKAMVRNGNAKDVQEAVGRLIHVRSHIDTAELPAELKGLYQHESLPHLPLPESIDAKAIAKEVRSTHGHLLPQKLRVPGALERAINRTYEHVKLGQGYRDWYKRYAGVVAKTAESSKLGHVSPRQLAQLMAVYSQRAMPTENFRRAVTSALQHGDFQVFGGQAEKAKKIIEDPTWFETHYLPSQKGPKISNYYANALQHLDPGHFAELYHGKPAPVTIDTHMNQMLAGQDRLPARQYDSLAEVFRRMAPHVGMEPHEVQAASWVSKKAANEAENVALKQAAKGNTKFVQRPASEYLHSSGDAYERAYEKYQGALFQQEQHSIAHDTFNPQVAQVTSEANPDPKLWPELRSSYEKLSPEQKVEYGQAMDKAVAGKFEHILGLDHLGNREGLGIWRGVGEHGAASHLLVGPGPITPEVRSDMEALTAAQGIAKHQNSVSWGRPVPPAEGQFRGVHWTPPAGADPVEASAALDKLAGDGNVGFIHAPDGGFYVINFSGEHGADFAIRRLGGEQTDIGWQGGYTIDKRIATPADEAAGARTFQDAINESGKASAIWHELGQVRGETEQIQSHFLGTNTARIVSHAEAQQLAEAGTHVFHGTSPVVAEHIMADRTLRIGDQMGTGEASHEAAWTSQNPDVADFYKTTGHGVSSFQHEPGIVAIPRERIPMGEGNAKHPFGNYGSPDDILFQGEKKTSSALQPGDKVNVFGETKTVDRYDSGSKTLHFTDGTHENAGAAAKWDVLGQGRGEAIKGAFDPQGAHGAIIHLTKNADVTTFPHELGHFLRRYGLNAEHEARLAEWAGVKNGEWTRSAEEKFARGLEKMIRQGDAPNNMVEEFKRLEPLFREVYPNAGHPLPTVPADIAQVYREILGHRDGPQALYWTLHNALVSHSLANEARQGAPRTPEEAKQHVLDVSQRAKEEGFGRALPKSPVLGKDEMSVETGGKAGLEVRRGLVGVGSQRNEQEAERAVERSKRAGSLRGLQKDALNDPHPSEALTRAGGVRAGQLPHSQFENFHGLRDYLDELATHIIQHPHMLPHEKQNAWEAILNGIEGQVPRKYEQKLLERAFGKQRESLVAQIKNGTFGEKIANVLNVPRALMASGDLSAPFRQGLVVLASHPGAFFEGFPPMLNAARSEKAFQAGMQELHSMPTYALAEKSGLSITEIGNEIGAREEQFASNLAEHLHELPGVRSVPGLKHVAKGASSIVRGSDRAYVLFLNRTRMRLFNLLTQQAAEEGYHLNDKLTSDIAKFVNSATGRGDLGALKDHAASLNTMFFSPRLLKSRLDFLNPHYYMTMEPFARQQALRAAVRLAGTLSTILMFAKAAGATVVDDPRNADFGKIRIGDTRLDIAGGFTQPLRLVAQLYTGQIVSSQTGRLEHLTSTGFGRSRLDVASQFLENKFAPVPSTIVDLLRGSQFGGQPITAQSEIAQHMVPLLWQDMAQVYHSTGPAGIGYGLADLFGVGVQNYGAPGAKTKKDTSTLLKQSMQAGLGKPPAAVQNDVQWKAKLDAATYAGMDPYKRAQAAVQLYDQRYGTHLETQILPHLTTEGQAEALYTEVRARLFPSLEHWQSAIDKVLRAQKSQQPTPNAPQPAAKKTSAPAPPVAAVQPQDVSYHVPAPTQGVAAAHHTQVNYSAPVPADAPGITHAAEDILQHLAAGNYDPVKALPQVMKALSAQPLQHIVTNPATGQSVAFQVPKYTGPLGKAARGAVALAQAYLGTPYVWGGESPQGFDCSGLAQYVYAKLGISIPRTSQEQFQAGQSVPKSRLLPGDLVFFAGGDGTMTSPGHVGIYIGHGKFIEAPHTGAVVRISNLAGYPGYVGARRYTHASRGRKAA